MEPYFVAEASDGFDPWPAELTGAWFLPGLVAGNVFSGSELIQWVEREREIR